jgi:hypothetical protein
MVMRTEERISMPVDPEEMKREIAEISRRIEAGEQELNALRAQVKHLQTEGLPTHTTLMYLDGLQRLQDSRYAMREQLRAHVPKGSGGF